MVGESNAGRVCMVGGKEREWGVRTPTGTAPPSFIQRSGRLVEVVVRAPQPRQLETCVVVAASVSLLYSSLEPKRAIRLTEKKPRFQARREFAATRCKLVSRLSFLFQ